VDFSGTSHLNYLVIKTCNLAEQKGSYTPNPTPEQYSGTLHIYRQLLPLSPRFPIFTTSLLHIHFQYTVGLYEAFGS
jgi:hypothetical protein